MSLPAPHQIMLCGSLFCLEPFECNTIGVTNAHVTLCHAHGDVVNDKTVAQQRLA